MSAGSRGESAPEVMSRVPIAPTHPRRWIPALVLFTLLGCKHGGEAPPAPPPPPPPIILIDIDTLRADHLSSYGYDRETSPNLDALASEATRFEWAFTHGPNTPPGQGSILTGLYPSVHGFTKDGERLAPAVHTLAEILSEGGYHTEAYVDGGYLLSLFGLSQGFAAYDDQGGGLAKIGPKVQAFLRAPRDRPFFLFVHTYDVHVPYDPPEPYASMFLDGLDAPTPGFEPSSEALEEIRTSVWTDTPKHLAANDLAFAMARYDGGIRYVDDWLGRLFQTMRETGLWDEAVLVVLADHGEEFQEHGSVEHEKLYATVTRIPLLVRAPRIATRASVVQPVVEAIDVAPTLLELAGLSVPDTLMGTSLAPLLAGRLAEWTPKPAISESPYFGVQRAVVDGRWHLIRTLENARSELFDLHEDPFEQHDLAQREPEVVTQLGGLLERWQERVDSAGERQRASVELDDVAREQLERLGYLDE